MNLCDTRTVRALMAEAGITFRHEYGQNFLIDRCVPEEIAEACADKEDVLVLEIGPGIGCMTRELCERYARVVAVEIDSGLLPILEKTLAEYDNVRVVNADIMKIDLAALIQEEAGGRDVVVCANLPYYITTPILMRLLESGIPFRSITVMVQAEVADRLAALPGKSDYGAITAVLGYYGTTERLFTVPPDSFLPAPKVASAVVRIRLYAEKPLRPADEKLFFNTIHAAFGMRRKTLLNALGALGGLDKAAIGKAITMAGIDPGIRGERLSTAEFCCLADALATVRDRSASV